MSRIPALLASLVLLAGCTGSDGGDGGNGGDGGAVGGAGRETERPAPAVRLVSFPAGAEPEDGRERTLDGCGSIGAAPATYETPVLIAVRLRVDRPVRLLPATYAERSNAIDGVTQHLGPDPGPAAPHVAVFQGAGPTAERVGSDGNPLGDLRESAAGVRGAQASWAERLPLDRPRRIGPGDHYLFVEVDPAMGGMDLHELTARWTPTGGGATEQQRIGGLSLRVRCGS